MPTPIAHSFINLASYCFLRKGKWTVAKKFDFRGTFIFLLLGVLPDLDFIPGILIGEPNRFHHIGSHSLVFAFIFAASMAAFFPFFEQAGSKNIKFIKNFFLYYAMILLHLLLDFFTVDLAAPFGIRLFWPAKQYYIAAHPFIPTFDRHPEVLLKVDNLLNLLVELVVFGAVFGLTCLYCRHISRKKRNS